MERYNTAFTRCGSMQNEHIHWAAIWSVFAYACAYEYINKSAPAVFRVRNKMLIDCYNNNKPLFSIDSDELAYVRHYTRPHM